MNGLPGSNARALARLIVYLAVTLPLMPVQALFLALNSPLALRLPKAYHALCCRIFGIRLDIRGEISTVRPTLFVANHLSYVDIETMSAAVETSFIAKREVASWPLFGWLAKLQRTVFVDRRAAGVKGERDDVAARLERGGNLVLFAEGTSSDGNRLKPFKSALFSAAQNEANGRPVVVQPVTIAYTHLDEMPLGRAWRPLVSWYGDMDMLTHGWHLLGLGRLTATIQFHQPVTFAMFGSRKALAAHCESVIAQGLAAANGGRPMPPPEPASALPAAVPASP
jgi:1-acyl-sn-glycerol-3-phosphate acyltransferase